MTKQHKMILVRGVRYREADAKRLGLISDGKVLTNRSVEVPRTHDAPSALITSAAQTPEQPAAPAEQPGEKKPTKSASKADWVEYAKAHGVEDPESLTRDKLAALFAE